jgi:hypothetical protein
MLPWEEEIISYGNNWEHDEGSSHASDLEVLLKFIEYAMANRFQHETVKERMDFLKQIYVSWGHDKIDKMRMLGESFTNCPKSIEFLTKEEHTKGSATAIKYTWLTSKSFRNLDDMDKLDVLTRLASGAIKSTSEARNCIEALEFQKGAIEHLKQVCHFIPPFLLAAIQKICPPRGGCFFSFTNPLFLTDS